MILYGSVMSTKSKAAEARIWLDIIVGVCGKPGEWTGIVTNAGEEVWHSPTTDDRDEAFDSAFRWISNDIDDRLAMDALRDYGPSEDDCRL